MPFVANTPESFLGRADSKNPNSTCRGITSNGRPCRRPLTSSPGATPPRKPLRPKTPVASDPRDESQYCWQHKDQASISAHSSPGPRYTATPILEEGGPRSSLDTLADRLGLMGLEGKEGKDYKMNGGAPQKKKSSLSCCCFSIPIDEGPEPAPPRPQPQPVQQRPTSAMPSTPGRKPNRQNLSAASAASPAKSSRKSTTSQTARLKDLIPDDLDTATASALLTELARPHVESEEAGYIYMFWLTPESRSGSVPVDAARDMLAPPSASPRSRRASDVVSSYADKKKNSNKKTMVLKIGRAANVQRRMNQWQRQCGRDIEVLRFYPYSPSNSSTSVPPRPTPHAHRVERLIHIELAGRGLRRSDAGACEACGREHREWFEVDASREGVREVDDVIRRWVEWDEAGR